MQRQGRAGSDQIAKYILLFVFGAISLNTSALFAQGVNASGQASGSSDTSEKPRSNHSSYETYVMCKSSSQARTLRIVQTSKGCITRYQRDGQEKVVATAQSLGVCHDVLGKIQKNLMENNWNCQDLSHSSVSSSD